MSAQRGTDPFLEDTDKLTLSRDRTVNGVSEMRRLRLRHHTNSSVLATSRTAADAAPAGTRVIGMLGGEIQPMGGAAAHLPSGEYNGEMR